MIVINYAEEESLGIIPGTEEFLGIMPGPEESLGILPGLQKNHPTTVIKCYLHLYKLGLNGKLFRQL